MKHSRETRSLFEYANDGNIPKLNKYGETRSVEASVDELSVMRTDVQLLTVTLPGASRLTGCTKIQIISLKSAHIHNSTCYSPHPHLVTGNVIILNFRSKLSKCPKFRSVRHIDTYPN